MSLRDEPETLLRYEAAAASEVTAELMLAHADNRSPREFGTNEWLQAFSRCTLDSEDVFGLADRVERAKARLGPEDGD